MRLKRLLAAAAGLTLGIPILGAAAVGILYLREPKAARPPAPAPTRDGRWRQDVEYLAQELPRLHANAFHSLPRAVFDSAVARLIAGIPALDDGTIRVRIASILAAIGDGHTSASPRPTGERTFPIRVRAFSDGVFVSRTGPGFAALQRAQLLGIDSLSVAEALARVATVISHDDMVTINQAGPGYLNSPTILRALGVIATADSATFLLRQGSSDTNRVTLGAREIAPSQWEDVPFPRPLYLQRPREPFWLAYLPESRTAYVRYNHCRDPVGFWRLSRQLRAVLSEHPSSQVVIDFRGNSGGNSVQFHYLMLPRLTASDVNQPGQLYGLIDGETFSSASTNAAQLRRETTALLIGQSPGGHPLGFGEVRSFRLPNSGITVWYASRYLEPEGGATVNPGLEADIPITLSSADYFGGRDPVLARALGGGGAQALQR